MLKGGGKWDRTVMKPIDKFKRRNFPVVSKECTTCHKRRITVHHYLCNVCWQQKQRRRGQQFGGSHASG